MTAWTCAKCGTSVDGDRSICRACGSARRRAIDVGPSIEAPPVVSEVPESSEDTATAAPPWTCEQCRTVVEGDFEVCWQCGASREGEADPAFRPIDGAAPVSRESAPLSDLGPDEHVPNPPGAPPTHNCPACGTALVPIRLIDTSGEYGLRHSELSYSAGDARPGWFSGFPMAGIVGAQLCPRCGRISLYAVPTGGD